jgi:hypothetical protein
MRPPNTLPILAYIDADKTRQAGAVGHAGLAHNQQNEPIVSFPSRPRHSLGQRR